MPNSFGGFVHTSPLSSLPHDPCLTLASNCVRDYFGPTVQTVADCLQTRGGTSTLTQIVSSIRSKCQRVWNEERERLVTQLIHKTTNNNHRSSGTGGYKLHRARGPEQAGYVVEAAPIRAALLVLLQHSMVKVKITKHADDAGKKRKHTAAATATYHYRFDPERARLLPRYPRYVEYAKKALDTNAAALVEELLFHGRMRTEAAVAATLEHVQRHHGTTPSDTVRRGILEIFMRMVDGGFIERVSTLAQDNAINEEAEFDGENETNKKKRKVTKEYGQVHSHITGEERDDAIVSLLNSPMYRKTFPQGAIWRVNVRMFHDSLRAFCLGRLVAERYGHKVQSAGSMVTAALKFAAHQEHAVKNTNFAERGMFTPADILMYLPKPVREALESKPGGAILALSNALLELSQFTWPPVVMQVEESEGHARGGVFEIATRQLVEHLKGRVRHQVILDSHGEVAARTCSIMESKGYQESDAIAEAAMAPAKDVREVLHRLYRANYITLLNLQQSKQHNPANAIYLWTVVKSRMLRTVTNNVCTALCNVRLRRQHEMEQGKDWIDRAKEISGTENNENGHELDKVNYNKFCQGLERLDNAALQLDETLMVLRDF